MTYRDDHDAALARLAALEQELEAERRRAREAEARAAVAEDERDRLAAENEGLRGLVATDEPDPDGDGLPRALPSLPSARSLRPWKAALLGALGVLVGITLLASREKTGPGMQAIRVSEPPQCSLRTSPPGAEVVSIGDDRPTRLGWTPLALDAETWWHFDRVELRLAGHEPRVVDAPVDGGRCRDVLYPLERTGAR